MAAVRELIALQCPECRDKNYTSDKNRKKNADKLVLSKFCRRCRRHTDHKETKIK
jgi:large subunit ribosomal protein L33